MTLSPWLVYLWGIADAVKDSCGFLAFLSGLFALIGAIVVPMLLEDKETPESIRVSLKKLRSVITVTFFVTTPLAIFTPSSKTIAIMVIAPAIVNSDPIQKDLPEIYNAAVDALKEQLKK